MDFITMLSWWQWGLLALVPPAIIALYFLKLKRQPLEVPSTYLWHKSIEDLHVNSLWQRMRQNLLLFLQLLFVALLMLALLRPNWASTRALDDRLIFLIDNSASMRATDQDENRLAEAKRRVADMIEQMDSADSAMIISFASGARVEQSYSSNKQQLLAALDRIQPTAQSTALDGALTLAAGLANPGRSAADAGDEQVAEPMPATMHILSDGRFRDVQGFSLGNLTPVYVPIGDPAAENLGITAFSIRRNDDRPDQLQAFGRVENFSDEDKTIGVTLYLDGRDIDHSELVIPKRDGRGVAFDLTDRESGVLELRLDRPDTLATDNSAWAVINVPRPAKVLLVTNGNRHLERALATEGASKLANVALTKPADLKTDTHKRLAAAGAWDMIIYDDCQPEIMPRANTLFLGQIPPAGEWAIETKADVPQVIDLDRAHPIMQWIDLSDVIIAQAVMLKPPAGASRLIETTKGLLFAIAPREGFEDAVLGIDLYSVDKNGEETATTNWPIRQSFPTFVYGLVEYLGGQNRQLAGETVRPGVTVELRSDSGAREVTVKSPSGETTTVSRGPRNVFPFSGTGQLGAYEVREGDKLTQRFTVNLFDTQESDIRPRREGAIKIGYVDVEGDTSWEPARFEAWKYLLLVALVVLLFEWYIYNRRVYL
jgi:hypothetical protein